MTRRTLAPIPGPSAQDVPNPALDAWVGAEAPAPPAASGAGTKTVHLNVMVSPELRRRLKRAAVEHGTTVSSLVRGWAEAWLEEQEPNGRRRVRDLAARFRDLADRWEEETMFMSNSEQATSLPSYDAIVQLGDPAVPLILKRMQTRGGHWFHALRDITKEDPVAPADWGNVAAMQKAWLRWGRDHGRI